MYEWCNPEWWQNRMPLLHTVQSILLVHLLKCHNYRFWSGRIQLSQAIWHALRKLLLQLTTFTIITDWASIWKVQNFSFNVVLWWRKEQRALTHPMMAPDLFFTKLWYLLLVTCPDERGLRKAASAGHDACVGFLPALHWDDSGMNPGSQEMPSHLFLLR